MSDIDQMKQHQREKEHDAALATSNGRAREAAKSEHARAHTALRARLSGIEGKDAAHLAERIREAVAAQVAPFRAVLEVLERFDVKFPEGTK